MEKCPGCQKNLDEKLPVARAHTKPPESGMLFYTNP